MKHILHTLLVLCFVTAGSLLTTATSAQACNDATMYCGPPLPGSYGTGDRVVKTIKVTVCATNAQWNAISRQNAADTWWGEALADTGRPTKRWLKIGPVQTQCKTRHVVPGARVGTMFQCPPTVVGWHWTPPMHTPGAVYYMTHPEPRTKRRAAK